MVQAIEIAMRAAYHEAGHAVVGRVLGFEVQRVTSGDTDGLAWFRRVRFSGGAEVGRWLAVSFAGYLAERRFEPRRRDRAIAGAAGDFAAIAALNPLLGGLPGVGRTIADTPKAWLWHCRAWCRVARRALVAHWPIVEELASALIEATDGVVRGRALASILRPLERCDHVGHVDAPLPPRALWPKMFRDLPDHESAERRSEETLR